MNNERTPIETMDLYWTHRVQELRQQLFQCRCWRSNPPLRKQLEQDLIEARVLAHIEQALLTVYAE